MPDALVAIFAKPPVPGAVKTRLGAAIGDDAAADVAQALLRDAWHAMSKLADVEVVLATPHPDVDHGLPGAVRWDQGPGDLGEKVARILRMGCAQAPVCVALGADTAGLTPDRLARVLARMGEADALIAPSDDGGFWCLAVRACPDGLLDGLPWSVPTTFEATLARLHERFDHVVVGSPGWDVDTVHDLRRLAALEAGEAPTLARSLLGDPRPASTES